MRATGRCFAATVSVAGILAVLVTGPVPAAAQCSMMGGGGGGHDHSAMQASRAAKPSGSDRKLRQSIDRLLADERGRALLTEALLNDRAFMESLVQRLAAIPEWRAMASRELAAPDPAGAGGSGSPVAPKSASPAYACPMHPEVTSPGPGDCPKCGMALTRREGRRE